MLSIARKRPTNVETLPWTHARAPLANCRAVSRVVGSARVAVADELLWNREKALVHTILLAG